MISDDPHDQVGQQIDFFKNSNYEKADIQKFLFALELLADRMGFRDLVEECEAWRKEYFASKG